jgi:hypothetical protein
MDGGGELNFSGYWGFSVTYSSIGPGTDGSENPKQGGGEREREREREPPLGTLHTSDGAQPRSFSAP